MHVDEALIAAMEKIRDAMLDFEVAADKNGMSGDHVQAMDMPEEPSDPMDESPEEEAMDTMPENDEPQHEPKFTALSSHRFTAKPRVESVEVDMKSPNKMPVGRRRY